MSSAKIAPAEKKKPKLIDFKGKLLSELEQIAEIEGRTFSDLIRECARRYVQAFNDEQSKKRSG